MRIELLSYQIFMLCIMHFVFRFNEQVQLLYELLRRAENIKLAPELLEPEPPRLFGDSKYGFKCIF